jgi:hypothetical protein
VSLQALGAVLSRHSAQHSASPHAVQHPLARQVCKDLSRTHGANSRQKVAAKPHAIWETKANPPTRHRCPLPNNLIHAALLPVYMHIYAGIAML